MRKILGLLFFGVFLTGCYTSSLTMVGPATGVASGKLSEASQIKETASEKFGTHPQFIGFSRLLDDKKKEARNIYKIYQQIAIEFCELHDNVYIGSNCCIGPNVVINKNTLIFRILKIAETNIEAIPVKIKIIPEN